MWRAPKVTCGIVAAAGVRARTALVAVPPANASARVALKRVGENRVVSGCITDPRLSDWFMGYENTELCRVCAVVVGTRLEASAAVLVDVDV